MDSPAQPDSYDEFDEFDDMDSIIDIASSPSSSPSTPSKRKAQGPATSSNEPASDSPLQKRRRLLGFPDIQTASKANPSESGNNFLLAAGKKAKVQTPTFL
jgi:hypothetical protein